MTRLLPLQNGGCALVDGADFERLSAFKWYAISSGTGVYIRRNSDIRGGAPVYLHRAIMAPPKGLQVDHINGNTFDNRRANLRVCTHAENQRNKRWHREAASA